jgi:hypothetical protein
VQLAADEIAADMLLLDASTAAHTAAAAAAAAVTDADITEEADVPESAVNETDDDENSAQHLTFLFAALEEPALIEALQSTPALGKSISRMLPFLTYRRAAAAQALAAKFMEVRYFEGSFPELSAISPIKKDCMNVFMAHSW